jgi:hypothetical protein
VRNKKQILNAELLINKSGGTYMWHEALKQCILTFLALLPLELANKAAIIRFLNDKYEKENHERIIKSYFINIICISIQRDLLPRGNSGTCLLPPEIVQITPPG